MFRPWTRLLTLACLALCVGASGAAAQVQLRYDPPDTNLVAGQTGRLSILVDQPLEIRTIDVTVQYDPAVLGSLGGAKGQLYTDSGIFTFDGFEEDTPGQWHGYSVLMGSGLFIQGPGELYYWDFEGLADGSAPLHTVSVYLSRPDGTWYETVLLPDGRVTVGDFAAASPVPLSAAPLRIAPNPFNPATGLSFYLLRAGPVRVTVHDVRGRQIATLLDETRPAGQVLLRWNGSDATGLAAPSGVYLFRVESLSGAQIAKGVLLE